MFVLLGYCVLLGKTCEFDLSRQGDSVCLTGILCGGNVHV